MANLVWTPRLESAFKRLQIRQQSLSATPLTPDEKKTVREVNDFLAKTVSTYPECVSLDLIKRVSAFLLKYSSSSQEGVNSVQASSEDWIHTMLKGSCVHVPKVAPKERSPELEKLMDGYRAQIAEKEYQRMVASINRDSPTSAASSTIAYNIRQDMKDLKDVKAHTIGIVNVLYTGGAVFTAVFMISAHFTQDLGFRILLSFLAFVLIVACEAYLYSRHSSVASGAASGRKTRKVKPLPEDVIIATRVISSKAEKA
ncbi:hypothetical protein FBU30_007596 [Linnemannia zychae]|nr:hypothetical protein FBU30_007596 [Linnemannia zychae]